MLLRFFFKKVFRTSPPTPPPQKKTAAKIGYFEKIYSAQIKIINFEKCTFTKLGLNRNFESSLYVYLSIYPLSIYESMNLFKIYLRISVFLYIYRPGTKVYSK